MSSIDQTGCLAPQSRLQGRYIIRKTIGEGGMGSVYKAIDTQARNRVVAIKEMSVSHYQSPAKRRESEELFHREAEILSNLSHPNLPRVYAFFNENGRFYLVMDFIRGKTLGQLLAESETQHLPVENMVDYALQLCNALSYLHQQTPPIIFRDLKPGNIMVTSTGNVYLIDFGIARVFKQGMQQDTQRLGTPGFASPEHYGNGQTGPRSDLYSLGATLHFCLTGKNPRENEPTLFHFLPAHKDNPQVPLNLSNLIQRLVSTRENQRPPNAQAVQHELLAIQQQQPSHATPDITNSYDPELALAAQLNSQILRHARLSKLLDTSWTSMFTLLAANIYATLCAWLLTAFVPRSKQLYHNSLHAISSWATKLWHSFYTTEARLLMRDVWTQHFTLVFALSAIAMTGSSLYMLIILHYSVHLIAFYLCLFLLLQLGIGYTNQRIRHPLARGILTIIILFLLFTAIALLALPDVRPVMQAITLNQLLSASIVGLVTVSLLRPKGHFGWVDHVCLATIALTYAFLLSGMDTQVLQQWLAIPLNKTTAPINYILICCLCVVTLIEIVRYKYPFTGTDHLLLFTVALIAIPLQLSYGLQEIPHLSIFMLQTENIIKDSPNLISFNTILIGIPVIAALLWMFMAPSSSYLSRIPLLPLAVACIAMQSFLGPITYLPLLKPSPYPLAHPLDSILHLNQLTAYGLVLIIGLLLYHWHHPSKQFEQFSLFYVVLVCTLLQNAIWNTDDLSSSSALLQSSPSTTITESQLYLLAINKFLTQLLILITMAILIIAINNLFLHLAREFAWVDRQVVRIKQRFNWLNYLIQQINHLILLTTNVTCTFLLWLQNSNIQHLNPLSLFTTIRLLIITILLIASIITLIRISRPFNTIDRWIILINAIACLLVLLSGKPQQTIIQDHWKITSFKPWIADPHLMLPPQTIAFGLLLTALVSLMWVRRRILQTHRNMLKIGFGLTLACALLQWFNPAFLLAGLIMLTLSILLAMQVEKI